MRLGKDLENKPIISVTEGRMLGRAKDVFVDSQLEKLAGLFLGTEGMIRRKAQVIPSVDVVLFGIDVILVKDNDVITDDKALAEAADWTRLKELQGYEVHTPGGTKLGIVGDVILDEAGTVVGLSLARVFVKGPLAEQGTVQREVIVGPLHEDKVIHVDLAKLEGMVGSVEEEAPPEKTADEEPVEEPIEEPVEELVIEVTGEDVEEEVLEGDGGVEPAGDLAEEPVEVEPESAGEEVSEAGDGGEE